ncbi:phospholipase A2 inhibitor gamma subunit B-like [Leuresthes tenuis]|uniref:phospholipase A2 inhibitor gamma subunit B-like n=1 Tax=Leuresthes tenuis TaxID=355514 RepID=UPI003B5046EA
MAYAGGSKVSDEGAKTCALPQECAEHSLNYGLAKTVITTRCCTSDLCNTQSAPDASKFSPNGKKCFTCDGATCTKTLNCEGTEDHCITTKVNVDGTETTLKGCASKLMCLTSSLARKKAATGTELSCCQGNFCNSASSTSAGLLLMAVPLFSLVLLS